MTAMMSRSPLREKAPETLQSVVQQGELAGFTALSEIAACLLPLLQSLDWRGDARDLAEALPHHADDLSVVGLRNTLAHLGFSSRPVEISLEELDPRLTPCLFIPDNGVPKVVVRKNGAFVVAFDSSVRDERALPANDDPGTVYVFRPIAADEESAPTGADGHWFRAFLKRFRPALPHLVGVSLGLNVLALAIPLFILAVYDRVIPSGSTNTLFYLFVGAFVALLFEFGFRHVRSNMLSLIGARIDYLTGAAVFDRLLHLPPAQTEKAPLGAQLSRLRDFQSVRQAFTGPLLVSAIDLPFVLLFLGIIALLGGWLVLAPLTAIGLYAIIILLTRGPLERQMDKASLAGIEHQGFLAETATKMRAVRYHGMESAWEARHRDISAKASSEAYRLGRLASLLEVSAEAVKMLAGLGTLALGAILVLNGSLNVAVLIASMALVWRAIAPIQVLFLGAARYQSIRKAIQQIDGLMSLNPERPPNLVRPSRKSFAGRVTLNHVSFRYDAQRDPALFGINLDIPPGQIVAITGPSGGGKSTFLKVALGMQIAHAGSVMIDGLDLRQVDRIQLRQSFAYFPQESLFFHGTVAQNLRLAQPNASDSALVDAAVQADVLKEILALPEGFDTWLDNGAMRNMSAGLRQKLALARLWLRDAPVMLLDEPGSALDGMGDEALERAITARRGRSTMLIVTHRPSHMRIADRVIVIDRGLIRADGTPSEVLSMNSGGR